jgi:hypothetical protein
MHPRGMYNISDCPSHEPSRYATTPMKDIHEEHRATCKVNAETELSQSSGG